MVIMPTKFSFLNPITQRVKAAQISISVNIAGKRRETIPKCSTILVFNLECRKTSLMVHKSRFWVCLHFGSVSLMIYYRNRSSRAFFQIDHSGATATKAGRYWWCQSGPYTPSSEPLTLGWVAFSIFSP